MFALDIETAPTNPTDNPDTLEPFRYIPDSELMELIGKSIKAIQIKRTRLKKRRKDVRT